MYKKIYRITAQYRVINNLSTKYQELQSPVGVFWFLAQENLSRIINSQDGFTFRTAESSWF